MTVNDAKRILRENNIDENLCIVLPRQIAEMALCLIRTRESRWRVVYNERGIFEIDRSFDSEDEACRFFLRTSLCDPVNRKNFKQSDLPKKHEELEAKLKPLLEKYGLN